LELRLEASDEDREFEDSVSGPEETWDGGDRGALLGRDGVKILVEEVEATLTSLEGEVEAVLVFIPAALMETAAAAYCNDMIVSNSESQSFVEYFLVMENLNKLDCVNCGVQWRRFNIRFILFNIPYYWSVFRNLLRNMK